MFCNLLLVIAVILCPLQAQYSHSKTNYVNTSWMSTLDNGIPLRKLSIIGTHSSMSTGVWGDAFQTQSNDLMTQLNSGVRALDIRCRHYYNSFPVHDRLVYLNIDLGGVLNIVQNFLTANPLEVVLMHIVEEYNAAGNTRTFEQTFMTYETAYASLIWSPTTQNPCLGETRGKVVIIQDFPGSSIHGLMYSTFTVLPHTWFNTNWDLYNKWTSVKSFLQSSNAAGVSQLSFWTGHGGSFPYFVASGKSSPSGSCLATGLTTPGFKSSYPDFPRVACFIGICTICFEGIDYLAYNWLGPLNINYLGIVFTDFVGDVIIQKAISMNVGAFVKCSALLLSQGCTFCSSTGQCLGCNTTLHYLYVASTFSCVADIGYYLPTSTTPPALCSTAMKGCLQCISATVCTVCDTYINYQLLNGSCAAAQGYYLDANGIPVKCTLFGCQDCISATVCSVCDSAANFIMNPSTNTTCTCDNSKHFQLEPTGIQACVCVTLYYLSSNNTCDLMPTCPANYSGCLTCDNATNTCLLADNPNFFILQSPICVCQPGYYYTGTDCQPCNLTLTSSCTTCASASLCLTCFANFTLNLGQCICKPQYYLAAAGQCLICPVGCLMCNNASVCIQCDTANNFTEIAGVCQCLNGMFLSGTVCQPCGAMAGCLTCTMTGCTSCDAIYSFSLSSSTCVCPSNMFINSMDMCEACTALACLSCVSQTNCTSCNTTIFYLDNSTGICQQICGDGVLYTLECDDGNLIDGDGCSSTCAVEKDWTCVGGSNYSPSSCSYSGPIYIKVVTFLKDPNSNTVNLVAQISPVLASMSNLTFSSIFTPDFPIDTSNTAFDNTTGLIDMTFTYTTPLNNVPLSCSFTPPAIPAYFYMQAVSVSLPETTDNNLALKVYPDSFYDNKSLMETIVSVLGWTALAACIVGGIFVSKLMAVEMILIFQIAYCGLSMIKKLEVWMDPMKKLQIVNGYNSIISDTSNADLPARLTEIYYHGSFLSNFSVSLVLPLIPIIIGVVVLLVSKKKESKDLRLQSYRILKEWQLSILLFVQFQLILAMGIAGLYGSNDMMGIAIGGVILGGIIAESVLFIARGKNFGEYKDFFRDGKLPQNFYLVTVGIRLIIAISIIALPSSFGPYAAFGFSIVDLLLKCIFRPYKRNIRPITNSVFVALILLIYMLSALNITSENINFASYLPLILLGVLYIALIFNIAMMAIWKIRNIRQKEVRDQNEEGVKEIDKQFIESFKQKLNHPLQKDLTEGFALVESSSINPHKKLIKEIKKINLNQSLEEYFNDTSAMLKINELESEQETDDWLGLKKFNQTPKQQQPEQQVMGEVNANQQIIPQPAAVNAQATVSK